MFWVVDNFLMRKHRKPKPNGNNPRVEYLLRPSEEKSSDDEVVLHSLIQNEAQDTVLDDGDVVHRALR